MGAVKNPKHTHPPWDDGRREKFPICEIPPFVVRSNYSVNVGWDGIESSLATMREGAVVDLSPDFQRVHVWTTAQQIAYVEYILRGGVSGREIFWNCPQWQTGLPGTVELVDGKQRLEAVRSFMRNEIPAFGRFRDGYLGHFRIYQGFIFTVNSLQTRAEVLRWYLDINAGGTPHTKKELERVRALLAEEEAGK